MSSNLRLMVPSPSSDDDNGAAYQQVAESRAAAGISEEFRRLMEGSATAPAPAAPAKPGAPTQSGNPDFDALMNGGKQPAPAQTIEGGSDAGSTVNGVPTKMDYAPAATLRPFNARESRPNPDGSYSTEITTTWQTPEGDWVNVPSLWKKPDGSDQQFAEDDEEGILGAMQAFEASSGKKFPRFKSVDEAVSSAEARSEAGGAGSEKASVVDWLKSIGKDLGAGAVEAPRQVVGGVIDALGEMDQFMQQALPIGGMKLFDENGNFDPGLLSSEQMMDANKAGEDLFKMIAPAEADTVTGGFVRATSQFLTGFIPGLQATKGVQAMKGGAILSNMAAGAIADMVVFDPNEDRLSTFLNQVPALSSIVPDYLADNNPDQSHWEGRMKNAIEGAGLGLAVDGLLSSFKYYKAARKAKAAQGAAENPLGATVEAAKDELAAASRAELAQDIPDTALHPLGDMSPDAPLLIEAPANATATEAFGRIAAGRERAAAHDANSAALNAINATRERFAAAKGVTDRDPMDDMLDELRSGAVSNAKIPKRPISEIVKRLGGVDPASSLAGELRGRGVTARAFPGLYRKGGLGALDNIPASEHAIFTGRTVPDAAGYIEEQSFIDGLESELKGEPWMTAESQKQFDDIISPLDDLEVTLDQMGINYKDLSNEQVKARIKAVQDEEAIFNRDLGQDALFDTPRTLEDIEREAAAEAGSREAPIAGFRRQATKIEEMLPAPAGGTVRLWRGNRPGEVGQNPQFTDDLAGIALPFRKSYGGDLSYVDIPKDRLDGFKNSGSPNEYKVSEEFAALAKVAGGVVPAEPKIFINLARINTADDVKAVLQQTLDLDAANIKDKTRGVVSNEQTIKESSAEYRDLNDLIGRAPGPMNAAQATAARRVLASSAEQIVQLARLAQAPNATPADIFNFRRGMAVHYALQSEVVAARTETARALQAWAIPVAATKARSDAIADLIARGGGSGDIQKLAGAIANAGDPTKVNVMARELGRAKFGDAMYQIWINSILSGPKSHMANILGNSATALYSIPERYMAAGISKAFGDGDIQTGEATALAFGLVKGVRDAFRLVNPWRKNVPEGDALSVFNQIDDVHQSAISADALGLDPAGSLGWGIDMLGKAVNVPGTMLNVEDRIFKAMNYRGELHARAYRTAASEGLEGKEFAERVSDLLLNPPENLKADALDYAQYQTLARPLSGAARQALGGISKINYVGPVFKLVMPFVKVTANVMKYGFERTPLAYASGAIRADIAAGGARAAQAHARVALGTMMGMAIMDMVSEGTITGGGPIGEDRLKSKQMRDTMRGVGDDPPYSIKINGRWYAYNRLDPIAMNVGLFADMAQIFGDASEADSDTMATGGVLAMAQNLASKQYLSGMLDFMAAIDANNPQGDFTKYVADTAQGMMPFSSFLRSAAQSADPIMRETRTVVYGDNNKVDPVATFLQSRIDGIKAQIPGLSDSLPARRDLYGEPMTRASGIGWGWDMISPIASRVDDPDPVTKILVDNKIAVSFPERSIEGVKLSSEEYDQYTELAGKMTKTRLDELVSNAGFKRLSDGPDGMKAELVRDTIKSSREIARAMMLQKNPDIRDRSIAIKQQNLMSLTGQ